MGDSDEEIRRLKEGWRLLGSDVQAELIARGWAVTDLEVGDDEPLEFFWPPTAPSGYGASPEPVTGAQRRWPQEYRARQTPWTRPTRITRTSSGWRVEYGAAIAQEADPPRDYPDDPSLLVDMKAIECWPMSVNETRRVRMERVFATTTADAHDHHSQAVFPTEPYASRMDAIRQHERFEYDRAHGLNDARPPTRPRLRGDLRAQMRLLDAEAQGPRWPSRGRLLRRQRPVQQATKTTAATGASRAGA